MKLKEDINSNSKKLFANQICSRETETEKLSNLSQSKATASSQTASHLSKQINCFQENYLNYY
jgi:hypothetical protein